MDKLVALLGKMYMFVGDPEVLADSNLTYVVFKLMDRGLSVGQIDRAMRSLVGNDWRAVQIPEWCKRLQTEGFILQKESILFINDFIDDLEALIRGKNKLDNLSLF